MHCMKITHSENTGMSFTAVEYMNESFAVSLLLYVLLIFHFKHKNSF